MVFLFLSHLLCYSKKGPRSQLFCDALEKEMKATSARLQRYICQSLREHIVAVCDLLDRLLATGMKDDLLDDFENFKDNALDLGSIDIHDESYHESEFMWHLCRMAMHYFTTNPALPFKFEKLKESLLNVQDVDKTKLADNFCSPKTVLNLKDHFPSAKACAEELSDTQMQMPTLHNIEMKGTGHWIQSNT
jgi:hypothetical protein